MPENLYIAAENWLPDAVMHRIVIGSHGAAPLQGSAAAQM
jgi:hypothetical protein